MKESGLSLAPSLPEHWDSLEFNLQYQNRTLTIKMERSTVTYSLIEGDSLSISHNGEIIDLEIGENMKLAV